MDEDAPHRMRWPRVLARVIGYSLLAAVLYVMSDDPVWYLLGNRSNRLDKILFTAYAPVDWLFLETDLLEPLHPYYDWWDSLPGGPQDRFLRRIQSAPAPAEP